MVVQDDLRFAQQCTPTARNGVLAVQMVGQVGADRLGRRNGGRKTGFGRQAHVPARRMRRVDRAAGITEHRAQRFQQRFGIGRRQLQILPAGQQAGAIDIGAHPGRIGAQPRRASSIAGIGLPADRGDRPALGQQPEVAQQLRLPPGGCRRQAIRTSQVGGALLPQPLGPEGSGGRQQERDRGHQAFRSS